MTSIFDLADDKSFYLYRLSSPENITGFDNFYFCGFENITYLGRQYSYIPFVDITGLSTSSTGVNAEPNLIIGDNGLLSIWIRQFNDLKGFEIGVRRMKRTKLTSNNPLYTIPENIYIIAQKTSEIPRESFSFKLKQRASFKSQIPARLLCKTCTWKQYRGAGCEYAGSAMFDVNNVPTSDARQDVCNLSFEACELRGNTQNFSGVPTIDMF